ncbi:MAG TPA: hypothetical protein VGU45_11885 [Microvirga sp.]|jgi:hypothetical protein|nr:hypothetical protein [Microvirga sp.]
MKAPDPYTTLHLDRENWPRILGDLLRSQTLYLHREHPFVGRLHVAAFDDYGVSRSDFYRRRIFSCLVDELPTMSMQVVAGQGCALEALLRGPKWGRGERIDPTAWARSSQRREAMCPQGALAWFREEDALEGFSCEVKEVAGAIWAAMEGIYAEIEQFHEVHRPASEREGVQRVSAKAA